MARAEFHWNDDMPLGEFITRFMETTLAHGEQGRLLIDGTVHGQPVQIALTMELLAVKGKTS
jgi:hypothetical protein